MFQNLITNMENKFKTNDISLTAFLLTQRIKLIDIKEEEFSHYYFLLSNPDRCEKLRKRFLNNALAPAQELFSKREMLISEVKSSNSTKYESRRGRTVNVLDDFK